MTPAQTVVGIVLPSTRSDGTTLALSDIASVTVNKADGNGAFTVLDTLEGPFTSATQSVVDPNPDSGATDNYAVTVTDSEGNTSGPGSASVAIPPSSLAPPSPPSVTATYQAATP